MPCSAILVLRIARGPSAKMPQRRFGVLEETVTRADWEQSLSEKDMMAAGRRLRNYAQTSWDTRGLDSGSLCSHNRSSGKGGLHTHTSRAEKRSGRGGQDRL